jgi:hypothetical protein
LLQLGGWSSAAIAIDGVVVVTGCFNVGSWDAGVGFFLAERMEERIK